MGNIINVIVFIVKCWLLVFVMMWVRWTLPRLRIDQVMMTCLKYLLPLSCALLLLVSVWQLVLPAVVLNWWKVPMGLVCLLATAVLGWRVVFSTQPPPLSGMPGVWNMPNTPRLTTAGRP
jgi:NADH-quinone oxidoreductase subunit H